MVIDERNCYSILAWVHGRIVFVSYFSAYVLYNDACTSRGGKIFIKQKKITVLIKYIVSRIVINQTM